QGAERGTATGDRRRARRLRGVPDDRRAEGSGRAAQRRCLVARRASTAGGAQCGAASSASAGRLVRLRPAEIAKLLAQRRLEELSRRGARDLLQEHERVRQPELREARLEPGAQLFV